MTPETVHSPTADQIRNRVHQMWGSVAESWGEHVDHVEQRAEVVTRLMIDAVAPAPGEEVLELACGAGGLGLAIADQLHLEGRSSSPTWRRRWWRSRRHARRVATTLVARSARGFSTWSRSTCQMPRSTSSCAVRGSCSHSTRSEPPARSRGSCGQVVERPSLSGAHAIATRGSECSQTRSSNTPAYRYPLQAPLARSRWEPTAPSRQPWPRRASNRSPCSRWTYPPTTHPSTTTGSCAPILQAH